MRKLNSQHTMLEKEYIDMFTQGYEGYANAFTVDTLLHLSTVFPLPNARHQCISSFRLSFSKWETGKYPKKSD